MPYQKAARPALDLVSGAKTFAQRACAVKQATKGRPRARQIKSPRPEAQARPKGKDQVNLTDEILASCRSPAAASISATTSGVNTEMMWVINAHLGAATRSKQIASRLEHLPEALGQFIQWLADTG